MSFLLSIAKSIFFLWFFLYLFFHALIYLDPSSVKFLVFQNLNNYPFNNLTNPSALGQDNVHNFYVDIEPSVRVGVWHFIPKTKSYDFKKDAAASNDQHFAKYLSEPETIVIYVHGNDRDRSTDWRVELCQNLGAFGYHVFAIDYRGYGDSTGEPTETGIVKDVITFYNLIQSKANNQSKIVLYGHSLGTGIVSHAGKLLSEANNNPTAIILEAPFLNISLASRDYLFAPIILNNPWILDRADKALDLMNVHFNSEQNILKINTKILVFHAEDDWFIPQYHGIELVKRANENRPKGFTPVKLIEIGKEHKLGHFLFAYKELYPIVKNFIEN